MIGRDREIGELVALVATSRVVLVHGAAGVGKTSLVVEGCKRAAEDGLVPAPVALSLAGVTDPREAIERTAKAIGEPRPSPSPPRVVHALAAILERAPRTLIWDDLDERSSAFAPLARRFAESTGPARLVLVSRTARFGTKDAPLRAPTLAVKPLAHEDAVRLVRALEAERGRTLAESLADATGGNPLLIRLAMADDTRVPGDPTLAMKRYVEEHGRGIAGKVLALLAAADAPLDEHELLRAAGKGAREAIEDLRRYLLVVRDGGKVGLAPPAAPIVKEQLGETDAAAWRALVRIGESSLAASALDDAALLLVCRARLELGDPEKVIAILHEHPIARAAAPTAALDRLLRDVALRSRPFAATALRTLAREQLRVGDYDAARRTLDELPPPKSKDEAERVALLRAEARIRAGEPAAAQRAIDAVARGGKASAGVALTQAQLAILRGELAEARATLERIEPKTQDVPQLEARRAVQIAASHLYEERYDLTHAWVARARATQIAAGIPVEPVVTILDVHALLGLGDVERADEVREREARGRPDEQPLEIASLVRRGDLLEAIALGDAALASQDRRADLLFRSVLARDLARAYLGLGQLAKAGRAMRIAEAGADEPSLAALRPICDAELARIAEAEGDLTRARRYVERAHAKIPASPFVAIDRDVLHGRAPIAPREAPPAARAYASLRGAELALATAGGAARDLESARESAIVAERFYSGARLHRETARARLARAEALARLGDLDAAEEALAACDDLAVARGYVPVVVACGLVRAAIGERRGDLGLAARALEAAVRAAGDAVDASLERAAARLDVVVRTPRGDGGARRPYEPLVARLGLARPADVVWRVGARTYLASEGDPPPERVACTVDVAERAIESAPGKAIELPEQRVALLSALAEAGDRGATLEELFGRVWRGTFHPLRHRNAVYVALTRLKESLKPLGRDVRIAHHADRYRLAGPLPVAVRRRADREGLRAALERAEDAG